MELGVLEKGCQSPLFMLVSPFWCVHFGVFYGDMFVNENLQVHPCLAHI